MRIFILTLLVAFFSPATCFSQISWEFQIPPNSTFSINRFCITADSCKNITGTPGIFENQTYGASMFQALFLLKANQQEYIISNLNETGGHCKVKKEVLYINKIYTGTCQGSKVFIYTNETWYLNREKGIKSDIPLQMSIRVKCGDKWLNAAITNKEYVYVPTRIYY